MFSRPFVFCLGFFRRSGSWGGGGGCTLLARTAILLRVGKSLGHHPLSTETFLHLPSHQESVHPLHEKLRLLICKVLGRDGANNVFLEKLPKSFWSLEARYQDSLCHIHFKVPKVRSWDQCGSSFATLSATVNFLADLHERGASHSALCIARSALSCYLDILGLISFDSLSKEPMNRSLIFLPRIKLLTIHCL